MKNFPLISNLLKPTYLLVALGSASSLFSLQYYLMARLPGNVSLACTPGANLTTWNIIFAFIMSLLTGMMVSATFVLFKHQMAKRAILTSSTSGITSLVAIFTSFCTICSLPILSILGISVSLELFSTYNLELKVVSLLLLIYGLYSSNRRLLLNCTKCQHYQFTHS